MASSNFMEKLRTFFGLRQDPPRNDFRNPIWSSDDEDDGDELYTRHEMEDFTNAMDIHQEFSRQMLDMIQTFGAMFGDIKSFINENPVDSFATINPLPPEHNHPEHFHGDNIRDYYLKPGYHSRPHEHVKEDVDLDGKISSNDLSGLFKKKRDSQIGPITPFNGELVPGRSFCQTIITTSVTKSDGSVETRRIVKSGNEVVEETVTSTSTGTDTRMPQTPGLDQLSSPGLIYNNVMSELSSLFRHFY
ncbi:uncharacterized protein LOC110375335 [Helicoverpa armigera]|uniref:HCLS1-associated protein X-1 n=1 Tax=Helicoverpa armigera TaxID=29058 RepID=A0A2W1C1E1_HELAM|nr:uncharacterized protein LOC124634519 [Helicoverpa zea]XP_049693159.1 uncharacterized protein LOC110375335 [Helicoverpa armigera]PZC78940.1 hypothetical protein B5X24_HaOG217030 [Helicoverpa armigera]